MDTYSILRVLLIVVYAHNISIDHQRIYDTL